MKVVCKYTHNVFIFGSQYEAKLVPSGPNYIKGKWEDGGDHYEIIVQSGDGPRKFKGDTGHFYTPEEWRELQLNKVLS